MFIVTCAKYGAHITFFSRLEQVLLKKVLVRMERRRHLKLKWVSFNQSRSFLADVPD